MMLFFSWITSFYELAVGRRFELFLQRVIKGIGFFGYYLLDEIEIVFNGGKKPW